MEELNSKIRTMMGNREFPEELKNAIENVYREYEQFYDENIRVAVKLPSVEEFFQYEHKNAMQRIFNNYREECEQKGEDVIDFLRKEENAEEKPIQRVDEEIEEIITNRAENNYGRITRISDIVVDSLRSTRNQLFMTIAGYTIEENEKSQIDEEINKIKTKAIQK